MIDISQDFVLSEVRWGSIDILEDDGSEKKKKQLTFFLFLVSFAAFVGGIVTLSLFYN